MQLPISFKTAMDRHSAAVESIMTDLRRGKSRARLSKAMDLMWSYEWCIRVEGCSLQELLQGAGERRQEAEDALTEDQLVAKRVKATHASLYASVGRWRGSAQLGDVPPEIVELHRKAIRESRAEMAAYEALPEAEKERQFQKALAEAQKMPGFMMFNLPIPPRPR